MFKEFRSKVGKQLSKSIKTLRLDQIEEYLKQKFQSYLRDNKILSQWTPPYTSQHNGVFERRNRTQLNKFQSMIYDLELKSFWDNAFEIVV